MKILWYNDWIAVGFGSNPRSLPGPVVRSGTSLRGTSKEILTSQVPNFGFLLLPSREKEVKGAHGDGRIDIAEIQLRKGKQWPRPPKKSSVAKNVMSCAQRTQYLACRELVKSTKGNATSWMYPRTAVRRAEWCRTASPREETLRVIT
jgi:hypothetical protein